MVYTSLTLTIIEMQFTRWCKKTSGFYVSFSAETALVIRAADYFFNSHRTLILRKLKSLLKPIAGFNLNIPGC